MGAKGKLVKVKKHSGYFRNDKTNIIYFRSERGGVKYKFSTGETQITKAIAYVEERLSLEKNKPSHKRKKLGVKNPKLSDVWFELMEKKALTSEKSTRYIYDKEWRLCIAPYWADKHVSDVTQNEVTKFLKWYVETRGDKTFFNTRKYTRMLFNYLFDKKMIADKIIIDDLDSAMRKRTKKKKVGRVYTEHELNKLLETAKNEAALNRKYELVYYMILLASRMGLRKTEILSIEWNNINFKSAILKVWRKNKYWGELLIPKSVLKKLAEKKEKSVGDKYVFESPTKQGFHISSQKIDASWTEIKVKAGIKNATVSNAARVHDLRHTFATKTATDNWNPIIACEYLDMSLKMYQDIYVHISPDMMKSLVENSFGGKV